MAGCRIPCRIRLAIPMSARPRRHCGAAPPTIAAGLPGSSCSHRRSTRRGASACPSAPAGAAAAASARSWRAIAIAHRGPRDVHDDGLTAFLRRPKKRTRPKSMRDNQPIASATASIASWDASFPSLGGSLNNFQSACDHSCSLQAPCLPVGFDDQDRGGGGDQPQRGEASNEDRKTLPAENIRTFCSQRERSFHHRL
jgi:hypothetical protein